MILFRDPQKLLMISNVGMYGPSSWLHFVANGTKMAREKPVLLSTPDADKQNNKTKTKAPCNKTCISVYS